MPIWQSGLLNVTAVKNQPEDSLMNVTWIGMGRQFEFRAKVIENNGKDRYGVESIRGPISFETRYHLSPVAAGTLVEVVSRIDTHVAFRMAESVLQSVSDAKFEADMQSLKAILESQTTPEV